MPFIDTDFPGLKIFDPTVFSDSRGYFVETFNENTFKAAGIDVRFVQDNESKSQYGVVRGLHYQLDPHAQAKLVRVIYGEVLDVVVDIRRGSPTYGQKYEVLLSGENKRQLFIPRGFAHGFSVLRDDTVFSYKCDNFYNKDSEGGVLLSDPDLAIDWRIPADKMVISAKDKNNPPLKDCVNNFEYRP
ncbi:MAG: dTDP-4-dehydrorhamnose 3,5-epimerase [Bacteroidetes bacterium]|nr:dTDP-4-dehydrorhamnose 3,5-epimerase [Bacteroidota bacterium]